MLILILVEDLDFFFIFLALHGEIESFLDIFLLSPPEVDLFLALFLIKGAYDSISL